PRGRAWPLVAAVGGDGASVVNPSRRSPESAEGVAGEPRQGGTEVELVRANVAEEGTPQVIVRKALDRFGRIDCLVNNSGITRDAQLRNLTRQAYDEVIDTNLIGSVMLAQAVLGPMIEAGFGRIVNVAS